MKIKVIPSKTIKAELSRKNKKALFMFGDLVAAEIDPYVPFLTGALSKSAFTGGKRVVNPKDREDKIYLSYSAAYAGKLWYGENFKFSKNSHHLAKAYWGKETFSKKKQMEMLWKVSYERTK